MGTTKEQFQNVIETAIEDGIPELVFMIAMVGFVTADIIASEPGTAEVFGTAAWVFLTLWVVAFAGMLSKVL